MLVKNFTGLFIYVTEWLSFDNKWVPFCKYFKKQNMLNTTLINGAEVMEILGFVFIGGNWIPIK